MSFYCHATKNEPRNAVNSAFLGSVYYSNSDKTMIYFVVNRFQIGKMKNTVHDIDPKAYVSISEVADIFSANNS